LVPWEAELMEKPPGTPDPRDPNAPTRVDDPEEDRRRSEITVGELMRDAPIEEVLYEPLMLPEIPPERMAALRRRRDELIPLIRMWFERELRGRE
jgi:hypothetical protein